MKTVNIVMRSRNDVDIIERTIKSILSQNYKDFELLSFDNASTDGTCEIIENYPEIKKFKIAEGKYIPGDVLNQAVEACDAQIIVFNNSDTLPLNANWLENLIKPILEGKAQISYARQVARPNADAWVLFDYQRGFGDKTPNFDFFSMASSAVSAEVFKTLKFDPEIKYSEDIFFAKKARQVGFKIAYAADSYAEHSHNYTPAQIKKRFTGEGVADAQIYESAQSFLQFCKRLLSDILKDIRDLYKTKRLSEIFSCLRARIIQKTSYYKARRSAHLARQGKI